MAAQILTTAEFDAQERELSGGETITDDMARTIASWWSSSAPWAHHILAVAQGQPFSAAELRETVDIELNNARVAGQNTPEDLAQLELLGKWADSLYIIAVWSSFGHTFENKDGGVSCMTCDGRWTVVHDDADNLRHGAYVASSGDEASQCPGHDVTHAEQDCDACEEGTCQACAFDGCNCLICA